MEPAENQVDPEQGKPAPGSPDNAAGPRPIVLRVPWFSQETSTSAVASMAPEALPSEEGSEPSPAAPKPAWRESASSRRRWPVLAALAGCLCAVAIGAVVDEFWWSRPDTARPQVRRAAVRNQAASSPTAPASEIEPLLAIPAAPRPALPSPEAKPVPVVTLSPEIIPLESEDEP